LSISEAARRASPKVNRAALFVFYTVSLFFPLKTSFRSWWRRAGRRAASRTPFDVSSPIRERRSKWMVLAATSVATRLQLVPFVDDNQTSCDLVAAIELGCLLIPTW